MPNGTLAVLYPIELPRGSTKQVTIYPSERYYYDNKLVFDTDREHFEVDIPINDAYASGPEYGVITDSGGELGFMAGRGKRAATQAGAATQGHAEHRRADGGGRRGFRRPRPDLGAGVGRTGLV